ncbi:hypothetical protein QQY24_17350 [Streptomyces sp. TG1A-8]|uniref:hypothetical protein n=1 Tax=Streptomyces sp. TG1A-8 TaxID=3051385 RepID=UPI00265C8822|nr:hypothetical protein [Streptomyces sp. TG1A-8]MDO0927092.1 hypothetical protein [Streptomyces sp. TG1A-8]
MAITDDLRKTLSDPTPLYFAAGTADLALRKARKVPALVEQLRAEAPARIEAVRNTDPKAVQERAAARAKEAQETLQSKVGGFIGSFDVDLKKLGETAQDLALRGVGVAAECAVRARETYEKLAEQGEQAVKTWRGEAAEEIEELAIVVEGSPEPAGTTSGPAGDKPGPVEVKEEPKPAEAEAGPTGTTSGQAGSGEAGKPAAKKAPAPRRTTATPKKATPPTP